LQHFPEELHIKDFPTMAVILDGGLISL